MAGDVELCNRALVSMGAETIRSFDEDNKRARACKTWYPAARDTLLGMHYWSCARGVKAVAPDPNQEHPFYPFMFKLPSECFTPFYIDKDRVFTNWELIGRFIATVLPTIQLQYTKLIANTGDFNTQFATALVNAVAGNIVYSITEKPAVRAQVRREADVAIIKAQAEDARIGNTWRRPDMNFHLDSFVNPGVDSQNEIGHSLLGGYPWQDTL